MDAEKLTSPLTQAIQPFIDSHSLAGAVMVVADREKVLEISAVGYADIAAQKAMPTDAFFWIASQSKPIAATALMMLVEEGRVDLDDPVAKYLPELSNLWVKEEASEDRMVLAKLTTPITVRQVLSHTSGMPFKSQMETPTLDGLPLANSVRSYSASPLEFRPGVRYAYSNQGINTVGRIVEVISGIPYEKFLEERLFGPLGMTDTTFFPNADQIARLAKSYKPNEAKNDLVETTLTSFQHPLDGPGRYPFPAGGLFSTPQDVLRFCQMILNGGEFEDRRYVSEASIAEMTRKQTEGIPDAPGYGLAWTTDGEGRFGHAGAYGTDMTIESKEDLILLWFIQSAGYPNNGNEALATFQKTASETYGHAPK